VFGSEGINSKIYCFQFSASNVKKKLAFIGPMHNGNQLPKTKIKYIEK